MNTQTTGAEMAKVKVTVTAENSTEHVAAPPSGWRERELVDRIARTEAAIPPARENLEFAQRDARILIGSAKMSGGDAEQAERAREAARRAQEDVEALECCVVAWRDELPEARRLDAQDAEKWRAYVPAALADIEAQVALQEAAEDLGRKLRAFLTARSRAANIPVVFRPDDRGNHLMLLNGGGPLSPAAVMARLHIEGAIFDTSDASWPSPNPMWTSAGCFRRFEGTFPGKFAHAFAQIAREYGAPDDVVAALTPAKSQVELGHPTESLGSMPTQPKKAAA